MRQVLVHRAWAQAQDVTHVAVGLALGHLPQHLGLTRGVGGGGQAGRGGVTRALQAQPPHRLTHADVAQPAGHQRAAIGSAAVAQRRSAAFRSALAPLSAPSSQRAQPSVCAVAGVAAWVGSSPSAKNSASQRCTGGERQASRPRPSTPSTPCPPEAGLLSHVCHPAPGHGRDHRLVDVLQPSPTSLHVGLHQPDEVRRKLARGPGQESRVIKWLRTTSFRGKVSVQWLPSVVAARASHQW